MPQADIMAKSIIIFLNVFSILLGLYSGFKFFKAYLDGKDIMKFKGYLINAFFLILIFPLLITVIGSKLAQLPSGQYAQIEIRVQTNDLRGVNDRISLSLKEYKIKPDEEHIIDLNIKNDFQQTNKFSIDVSCSDEKLKCDKALDILEPKEKEFNIRPKVTFKLPISINIKDEVPEGKYNFNITVKDEFDLFYDSIPLTISVG